MYDNAKNGVSCSNTFSQDISTVEKRISNSNQEIFWTDSEVVLAYIRNEAKRFKIFAANRTKLIKEHSDECQWFYISSKPNPVDHASRGIDICNQNKVKEWLLGHRTYTPVNSDDPELKKDLVVSCMSTTSDVLSALERHV